MKANEFIKKYGCEKAKELIKFYERCGSLTCDCDFNVNDLKALVESHELVGLFDGLDCAKAWVSDLDDDFPYQVKGSDIKFFKWQLEQAIADVESCM